MSNFTALVKEKALKALSDYNMLENTNEVVVGFSGGADSVCLLHLLNSFKETFGYSLRAIHINHGIRGAEADTDAEFSKVFCLKNNISFDLIELDCIKESQKSKESLEECGRRLRYKCFNEACGDFSKIATAHNANDNAETIIFNITRGSSVKGLCGIPYVRDNVIRPLLSCSRKEIEGYCRENDLEFVTDSTNLSTEYTRNKIRHLVLPVLEEINPAFLSSFASLSDNARCVSEYLNNNALSILNDARIDELTYNRNILLAADKAVVTQMLYSEFLRYSGLNIDNKKINCLYELLHKCGRQQIYGGFFAEVKKDYFRFYRLPDDNENDNIDIDFFPFSKKFGKYLVELEKNDDYLKIVNQINAVDMIDCNSVSGNLVLRTRKAGDEFTFPKRNVTKSLKKLFTEENVPIEIRNSIPVISDDIGVVWVFGFGVTRRCCVTEQTHNIICVRGKNNDR